MLGQNGSAAHQRKDGATSSQRPAAPDQRGDKKLAEVRAVLEKLQRIGVEPEGEHADDSGGDKVSQQPKSGQRWMIAAALGGVLLVGAGGFVLTRPDAPPQDKAVAVNPAPAKIEQASPMQPAAVQPTAVQPSPAPAAVQPAPAAPGSEDKRLTDAEKLIDMGLITEARGVLSDIAPNSPEAALMLARSYDPNILRSVASANAAPDAAEAERWYRVWYSVASAKGLQMEPERLDRIIRAMR